MFSAWQRLFLVSGHLLTTTRQVEHEFSPLPFLALNPYSASVRLDYRLAKIKSKPNPLCAGTRSSLSPIKPLEYELVFLLRYAHPLV